MRFNDEKALSAINYYKAATGTTTARTLTGDDLFDDDFGVGDYVEFLGNTNTYERDLFFTISTAIAATSYTGHWEYKYLDGAYADITSVITDGTSNFSTSGNVTWSVKDLYFYNKLQMRYIIDTVDTPTEGGAFTKAKTGDNTLYIENGDDTTFQLMQAANNSGGWNAMERTHIAAIVDRLDFYMLYCQLKIESGGRIADNTYGNAVFNVYGGNDIACLFSVNAGGELQLGRTDAGGYGNSGFDIGSTFGVRHANARMFFTGAGTLKIYGSRIYSESSNYTGSLDGRNCLLASVNSFNPTVASTSVDIVIESTSRGWLEFATAGKTYYRMKYHGFTRFGVHRASGTFYDCEWMSDSWYLIDDRTSTFTFIGCTPKPDYCQFNQAATFYWKHRCNVRVMDESGNIVEGATVVCKDKDGTQIFSESTDATGMITEQQVIETQVIASVGVFHIDGTDDDVRTPHTFTATYGTKTGSVVINMNDSYREDSPIVIAIREPASGGISSAYIS